MVCNYFCLLTCVFSKLVCVCKETTPPKGNGIICGGFLNLNYFKGKKCSFWWPIESFFVHIGNRIYICYASWTILHCICGYVKQYQAWRKNLFSTDFSVAWSGASFYIVDNNGVHFSSKLAKYNLNSY
jgi:hypothetical protein